ncbi:MAG TPA: sulfate adenylyltransferase, partial [Verrucomicrobiales bacterium]|nr:sulfate adenylyltransferase [Verrucomicrobiales bacterium]
QRVEAMLVWFSSEASLVERGRYSIRHTTNETKCLLKEMKYKVDIN